MKTKRRRVLPLLLAAVVALTQLPAMTEAAPGSDFVVAGDPAGYTYDAPQGVLTFTAPGDYTVSMAVCGTNTTTDTILVAGGGPFSVTLVPASGFVLPGSITVTMGGAVLTQGAGYTYDRATGAVSVVAVDGDILITAVGETPSYSISTTPSFLDFDSATAGYTHAFTARTVTIENTGNSPVTVQEPTAISYIIVGSFPVTLDAGETTVFTIQPETGLSVGSYNESITISTDTSTGAQVSMRFTVMRASSNGESGGYTSPDYTATVSGGGSLPVTVDKNNGSAVVSISGQLGSTIASGGNVKVNMPTIGGITSFTLSVPVAYLSMPGGIGTLTFTTNNGNMTLPADVFSGIAGAEGKKAELTIKQGSKSGLPEDVKAAIGDRPIIELILTLDGEITEWNNPGAPVTISIPYKPAVSELENPESIVIWYIDGNGNEVCVPNGRYDPDTGTVAFQTTHFSYYAVAYNPVSFNDVAEDAWYAPAVFFISAREITSGTGNGNYSPDAKLTRGEFIVLMMRAYGIDPDENPTDNFADAGNTYYTGYLAEAKRLGISVGVGNNQYAPGKEITRQEMFTLLYNALKVIGQLPQGDSGKALTDFTDAGQIDSWAKGAMTLLVKTCIVGGNDGALTPLSTITRAEMAQELYNLLKGLRLIPTSQPIF